jgi:hypothetical protein
MVGMGSIVVSDLPALSLSFGCPAKVRGVNRLGLERLGMPTGEIDRIDELIQSGLSVDELGDPLRPWEIRYEGLLGDSPGDRQRH